MPLGFRHCDPRFPFLWQAAEQPAARWHAKGEGPANYFADTPVGAWAEFIRHKGITEAVDLAGIRRSLWVAELPGDGYAQPRLPDTTLFGNESAYAACQAEATRLREGGAEQIEVPGAALMPGTASGWTATPTLATATPARDGIVWVLFGRCDVTARLAVEGGAPPELVLSLVRHL